MLILSISPASTIPTPTSRQQPNISSNRLSLSASGTFFESRSPFIVLPSGMTTAEATTGPAKGPLPASSIPAILQNPFCLRDSSYRKISIKPLVLQILFLSLLCVCPCLFASQVVKLSPSYRAPFNYFNLIYVWRIQRKYPFNSDAKRYLSDHKRLSCSAAAPCDNNALKRLEPFFVSFNNFYGYLDSVADIECGNFFHVSSFN